MVMGGAVFAVRLSTKCSSVRPDIAAWLCRNQMEACGTFRMFEFMGAKIHRLSAAQVLSQQLCAWAVKAYF